MRWKLCRLQRLELVAGLGVALALPALASAAGITKLLATQTTLSVETRDVSGSTQAAVQVKVVGSDGQPATGAVSLTDQGQPLAGVALDAQGQASTTLDLPQGAHQLTATYLGDSTHSSSVSSFASVTGMATTGVFSMNTAVSPTSLSLTAGESGTLAFTVTPVNASALSSSMFVTLSCSGLPDQASCSFNPTTLEIAAGSTAALTSQLTVQTQTSNTTSKLIESIHGAPLAWAFLLPLGGMAVLARRRRAWLSRLSLLALLGVVTVLGTTGCNPRWSYENHGPVTNPGTPAGTYTITISAQTSDGVTATTNNSTTFALTVK